MFLQTTEGGTKGKGKKRMSDSPSTVARKKLLGSRGREHLIATINQMQRELAEMPSTSAQIPESLMAQDLIHTYASPPPPPPVALVSTVDFQVAAPSAQPPADLMNGEEIQGASTDAQPLLSYEHERLERAKASPLLCYPLRLHPGAEIRSSLQKFVESNHLKSAFILSCVGSVRKCKLRMADSDEVSFLVFSFFFLN